MSQEYLFSGRMTPQIPMWFEHRSWQRECLKSLFDSYKNNSAGQFFYLVSACTGSGKSMFAALAAYHAVLHGHVNRLVYVAPNKAIQHAIRDTFRSFGLNLAIWSNTNRSDDRDANCYGSVVTYQSIERRPGFHVSRCKIPTMVFFDEIHHLGDERPWSSAALHAFSGINPARMIVGLSGTPFRGDNRQIPYVKYEPAEDGLRCFKADFVYNLGRAVKEGVCRQPLFPWLNASVEANFGGGIKPYQLDEDVPIDNANVLLSAAVAPGSSSRLAALKVVATRCQREDRKLIIFVGGNTRSESSALDDAEHILPAELVSLGIPREAICSVTSRDSTSVLRLEEFGKSDQRILITVNMVSEGVDIPELSAALFLTSITAKAMTIQRIGRVLRRHGVHADALIFMFRDPRYVKFAEQIEEQIREEMRTRTTVFDKGSRIGRHTGPGVYAIGKDAFPDGFTCNGRHFAQDKVDYAWKMIREEGLPETLDELAITLITLERMRRVGGGNQ